MRILVQGFVYIAVFIGVALAPLVFAAVGVTATERGFLTELSVAFGFVGLALMLQGRLDLTLVWVLADPPEGWQGETGYIDAGVLDRHLPRGRQRFQYFICGPNPMMDATEDALMAIEVPVDRIHTERFGWV